MKKYSSRQLKKNGSSIFLAKTCFYMPDLNYDSLLAESEDFKLLMKLTKSFKNINNQQELKRSLVHFQSLFNDVNTSWSEIKLPKAFYLLKKDSVSTIIRDFFNGERRFYLKHIHLLEDDSEEIFHNTMKELYYEFATMLCYIKLFENKGRARLSVGMLNDKTGSIYWQLDLSRLGITHLDEAKTFFNNEILPLYQQNLDKLFYNLKWSNLYLSSPKMTLSYIKPADYEDEEMFY